MLEAASLIEVNCGFVIQIRGSAITPNSLDPRQIGPCAVLAE